MSKRGENIYKRKDGRWEARVIAGYKPDGKAAYAYFYGRSYKEAKEKIFVSLPSSKFNVAHEISDDKDKPNFERVLDLWLSVRKVKLKKSSYVKYFNIIHNHIKPSLGKYPLLSINNTLLNAYTEAKLKSGKRNAPGGLSVKTVKDMMTVIKSALWFAKNESMMPDINMKLDIPREKPKEMRVLTRDEQTALEKYLYADIDASKLGVLLCLYTGLRIGEICALKWSDISLNENKLVVAHTMQRIQTLEDTSKAAKTDVFVTFPKSDCSLRTIPIPDFLMEKLKRFYPGKGNAYFLTGESGRYIEPRTYHNRFKSYVTGSGISDVNFHATRHTFATRCIEVGFDVKSLSEILGHANVKITLDKYVHPSFDFKRSNMNKLDYFH